MVSLFSCSVVCRFAYIMTAVVVVSCFSVFGFCCFVYTMTTVSVVLVFLCSVFAFLVMTMTFVVRPSGIFAYVGVLRCGVLLCWVGNDYSSRYVSFCVLGVLLFVCGVRRVWWVRWLCCVLCLSFVCLVFDFPSVLSAGLVGQWLYFLLCRLLCFRCLAFCLGLWLLFCSMFLCFV